MVERGRRSAWRTGPDRGLTLVELLVVVVILGILAGVAVPLLRRHVDQAHDARARILVRELGTVVRWAVVDDVEDPTSLRYVRAGFRGHMCVDTTRGSSTLHVDLGETGGGSIWPAVSNRIGRLTTLSTGSERGVTTENWCVDVEQTLNGHFFRYSAAEGAADGRCGEP